MSTVTIRRPVKATDLERVEPPVEVELERPALQREQVFPQSVASGGPTPTGVILWTRINPDHYDSGKSLFLEVAADRSFEDEAMGFVFSESGVKPPDNYTIRVDLTGLLDPDSVYYYRFRYRGVTSTTGRCRTLPAEDAVPDSLRFGVLNCQNYQNGYFGAMAHLAEADVDFVLHLGDYIYENVAEEHTNGADGQFSDRSIDLPDGETHPMSLDDFRHIYETYKTDPHLQQLHERHTVIQTWDDHAIANDRYWDYEANVPVFPDHPCGEIPEFTRYLTRAGIQAWWEFIPARIDYDPTAERIHDSFVLYRGHQFGDLLTLLLTDDRLFRSQPRSCTELLSRWLNGPDPNRTMLGKQQRKWLCDELRESEAVWAAWANAVLFKPLYILTPLFIVWNDSWNGFEAERRMIIDTLTEIREENGTTVVTLTGDMHMTLAALLQGEDADGGTRPVGAEFMTPSVTSVNPREKATEITDRAAGRLLATAGDSIKSARTTEGLREHFSEGVGWLTAELIRALSTSRIANQLSDLEVIPSLTLTDGDKWGYSIIEFTRDACTWDVYDVDKTVNSASAGRELIYRLRLLSDSYELQIEIADP